MKKYVLHSVILGLLVSHIATAQQLLSWEYKDSYSVEDMESVAASFGIPVGLLGFAYEVDVYNITYETPNATDTGTTLASGAVAVPKNYVCAVPLASYQHGTVAHKNDVPSRNSSELYIGMFFASNGFVVSMPDYLGLGDSPGLHPYVHAHSEATASANMLFAVKELLQTINASINDQLFLFGYSQGGHATMALHKYLQENYSEELPVTAAAPMSGPYDISGAQTQYLTADVAYATPGYLPYVVLAYQSVYGNLFTNPSDIFVAPYDELLPPLFDGTHSMGYINDQCPSVPKEMVVPEVLAAFENEPNHPLRVALRDNDIYEWIPDAPVKMCYCLADDQVSYQNTDVAYEYMTTHGATAIEKVNLGNLTHSGCFLPSMLVGKDLFTNLREWNDGMQLSFAVIDATFGENDGVVGLTISGGEAPYTVLWSDGSTTTNLENIAEGMYDVTVTDNAGCSISRSVEVGLYTGIASINTPLAVSLFPNPTSEYLHFSLDETIVASQKCFVQLVNTKGEIVKTAVLAANNPRISVENLPKGVYLVKVFTHKNAFAVEKVLVE
ncbi:MAG: T9SS type A sorting domain-containing protein [Chitinophagales bacterium]|nr:T9SS type A sorting domain-containing protein [Bacteroidota bacterium]MCB9043347.1 T9SS type A sorting domain-containing protein [Chitinophagales bacterium]